MLLILSRTSGAIHYAPQVYLFFIHANACTCTLCTCAGPQVQLVLLVLMRSVGVGWYDPWGREVEQQKDQRGVAYMRWEGTCTSIASTCTCI